MASRIALKTGQRIMIATRLRDGKLKDYVSQVLEIIDDKDYVVAVPISKGVIVPLMNGTVVDILYMVEEAGMYRFEAKIVSKSRTDVPTMRIRKVGDLVKDQRRNHFRVSLILPIKIRRSASFEDIEAYCKDLSGGGMRFVCGREFEDNELLGVEFALNGLRFSLQMRMVRKFLSVEPGAFEAAGEFSNISEADRNEIIGYLFEKQRLMMKTR